RPLRAEAALLQLERVADGRAQVRPRRGSGRPAAAARGDEDPAAAGAERIRSAITGTFTPRRHPHTPNARGGDSRTARLPPLPGGERIEVRGGLACKFIGVRSEETSLDPCTLSPTLSQRERERMQEALCFIETARTAVSTTSTARRRWRSAGCRP